MLSTACRHTFNDGFGGRGSGNVANSTWHVPSAVAYVHFVKLATQKRSWLQPCSRPDGYEFRVVASGVHNVQ